MYEKTNQLEQITSAHVVSIWKQMPFTPTPIKKNPIGNVSNPSLTNDI